MTPKPAAAARPFLKWAGGKRQLLPALRPFYPAGFHRYVEPFVGSGAVFLDLHGLGRLDGRDVRLADRSPDVIGCYLAVRDAIDEVIAELRRLARGYQTHGPAHFYRVRDRRFNPRRRALLAAARAERRYPPDLAAMLIYLNRTGFNGLFRLNARGEFNVPAGRYLNPTICDADNLRRVSRALQAPAVRIERASFDAALADVGAGDFVYLDPPYSPVSRTASFTAYTADAFGPAEQAALHAVAVELARRGARVVLSNSTAPEIRRLYEEDAAARAAGLRAYLVPARRAINSRGGRRGPVLEYVITNVEPREIV